MTQARRGFSIVELLVVIAVITILISLLAPAVQSAREAARRTTCSQNLKQLGLALHMYHDAHRVLPLGVVSAYPSLRDMLSTLSSGGLFDPASATPESSWSLSILPFLEQNNAAQEFDWDEGVLGFVNLQPPYLVTGANENFNVMGLTFSVYQCPSNNSNRFDYDVNSLLASNLGIPIIPCGRANYAANWGNTNWEQSADLDGDGFDDPGIVHEKAPFGRTPIRLSQVSDGLSNTVFLAEVKKGMGSDVRGAHLMAIPGGNHYMSRLSPNGNDDFYGVAMTNSGDQIPFSVMCESDSTLPCEFDNVRFTAFAGSRSGHSGGVYVLLGSGSVHFFSNETDYSLWIDLHGMSDARVANIDF